MNTREHRRPGRIAALTLIAALAMAVVGCQSVKPPPPRPLPPAQVRVVVDAARAHPDLDEYGLTVRAVGKGTRGEPRPELATVFTDALLRKKLRIPAEGALVRVELEAEARTALELGAGRTLVKGTALLGIVDLDGGDVLRSATLESESGRNSSEEVACLEVLRDLAAQAAERTAADVQALRREIRIGTIEITTDDRRVSGRDIAAPIVDGLERESGVLGVDHAGTARGARGPSARLKVWLATDFEGDLTEVVRGVLGARGSDGRMAFTVEGK